MFIENSGQWPENARYQVWGSPLGVGTTWLAQDAIWITVVKWGGVETFERSNVSTFKRSNDELVGGQGVNVKISFPGANPDVRIEPFAPVDTKVSYFLGDDPGQWRPAVPAYGGVRYVDLYPGTDLVINGAHGSWTWQFVERASTSGSRDNSPAFWVTGADVRLVGGNRFCLDTQVGTSFLAMPLAHQSVQIENAVSTVPQGTCEPTAKRSSDYAPDDDPGDLAYSTFLGGRSQQDDVETIAVDPAGRVYAAGLTASTNFPTTPGAFDPSHNGSMDGFIVRLSSDGSALEYATFLGGSSSDGIGAVALQASGGVFASGSTESSDFPTTPDAFDTSYNGSWDGFVVQLDTDGDSLVYSTFVGGGYVDSVHDIAIDGNGRATVAGDTSSGDFPTTPGAWDADYNGDRDVFVAQLSADGASLVYGTYLGGTGTDEAPNIAIDGNGRVAVAGTTSSSDFPTTPGAWDADYNGRGDVFVTRVSADGSTMDYGTFLGGSDGDHCKSLDLYNDDHIVVAGITQSSDFPTTPGAFSTNISGDADTFVVRLAADGGRLDFGTFVGGSGRDQGMSMAVDEVGRAYVGGNTNSPDFPATSGAFDTSLDESFDGFLARLSAEGSDLEYASFLGGNQEDYVYAVTVGNTNLAYVGGSTWSTDFPVTPGAYDPTFNDGREALVAKMDTTPFSGVYVPDVVAVIEQPSSGGWTSNTTEIVGYAIDLGSFSGTGVGAIHLYLDGPYATGTWIGSAQYGLSRPDVANQYGDPRFEPSGWQLNWDTTGVAPGVHYIHYYAYRSFDGEWEHLGPHQVVVPADHQLYIPLVSR
jgi:hypothetical protein